MLLVRNVALSDCDRISLHVCMHLFEGEIPGFRSFLRQRHGTYLALILVRSSAYIHLQRTLDIGKL